jgi:hypothetical protein
MPIRQQIVAMIIAFSIFFTIYQLVKRRKLREEYSWLWLIIGFVIVLLTLWYDLLVKITALIGAVLVTSTLFFFAIVLLLLVCLQFSIMISKLTNQVKDLTQEVSLLKSEIDNMNDHA